MLLTFGALEGFRQPDTHGFTFSALEGLGNVCFISGVCTVFCSQALQLQSLPMSLIVLFAALVLFFGFFMLPTRIHERYLFPAMSVLALMFPFLRKMRPMYIVLTITCFVNQAYVLSFLNAPVFDNQFIPSKRPCCSCSKLD